MVCSRCKGRKESNKSGVVGSSNLAVEKVESLARVRRSALPHITYYYSMHAVFYLWRRGTLNIEKIHVHINQLNFFNCISS